MSKVNGKKIYNNDSISSLKGADRVRKRPSVIFGSDGLLGCQHSVFEILSNAIDEAREGFGNKIEVKKHIDNSITIKDYGRGCPVDFNEKENKFNWELLFCEMYAGGKYSNNDEENYSFSLGLNGLGLCSTQYSSEYMDVEVCRDNYIFKLNFKKGNNVDGLIKKACKNKATYTCITWKPDLEVFTDIDVPNAYFMEVLKRQAIVNTGLTFEFYDEATDNKAIFYYENGINDYIDEVSIDKNFTSNFLIKHESTGRDREDKPEYKLKFEMVFAFNNDINLTEYYHNSSYLEYGGSPEKAVKSAFIYSIDKYIKSINLYKKDEKKIIFADIEDSLILISNSFSTITSYENQTKKSITNKFIQDCMYTTLKEKLSIFFIENKSDADKVAHQILANKRSRETAEKTRLTMRKKLTGNIDINNRVEKFVNCRSKDIEKRELYIVEGDSALGSCKLGRDANFQAIIPVRGKILNCLKADYEKIFNNDIIIDLLRVLGCGVEVNNKYSKELNTFDITQLRWSKIIICTDADVDGFQIRTLILTMLYKLVPSLIDACKIFIAESPLYEINTSKKTYFAYSEKEKNSILSKISVKYTIQRSKGLGENEPEMMWQTTMNPESRKLIQVLPEDSTETKLMFEKLLGDNIKERKKFINDVGFKYIDLTETL
jgi:DNA gyrase subunit B